MKRVSKLLQEWSAQAADRVLQKELTIRPSKHDYARIQALSDLYRDCRKEQILSELISAMLDEVEEAMPYIPGQTVVAEDEFGDPLYEDLGLTRQFEKLVKKYNGSE